MPIVPQRQVRDQGIPDAKLNPSQGVAAIGNASLDEGATRAAAGIIDNINDNWRLARKTEKEEADKADDLWSKDYDQKALNKYNEIMWNPETGVRTTQRGEKAMAASPVARKQYDDYLNELDATANNDTQRSLGRLIRAKRVGSFNQDIDQHESQEIEVVEKTKTSALLETYANDAVLNYGDVRRVGENLNRQASALESYNARKGIPQVQTNEQIAQLHSKTATAIVSRMIANGDDLRAKSFYVTNKELFKNSDDVIRVEKELEQGSRLGEAQRQTDKILSGYSTLDAQREAAKQIKDPKVRDDVDARLQREHSIAKAADHEASEAAYNDAFDVLEKTKRIEGIPVGLRGKLNPQQENALRIREKQLNEPEKTKTDWNVYTTYIRKNPKELAQVSEAELREKVRPYVEDAEYKAIAARVGTARGAKAGDKKKDAEIKSMYGDEELVLDSMIKSGWSGFNAADKTTKISGNKAKDYSEFRRTVDDAWIAYQHDHGKPPNGEEKKKISDRLLMDRVFVKKEGILNLFSADQQKSIKDLTPEERKQIYTPIDKIPPSVQDAFISMAKQHGVIGRDVDNEKAKRGLKSRLERAYAAGKIPGATDADILKILKADD